MRRSPVPLRRDWRQRVEALGFECHTLDGPYWVEDACYRFDEAEIDLIEAAGNELHAMCLDAVADVVRSGDYARLGLEPLAATLAERAWRAGEQSLYGRMDLAYDGTAPPKLLEYNADTPTALFEAAVVQWYWLEDTRAGRDQFNLVHEALVQRWPALFTAGTHVHFAGSLDAIEDRVTTEYLRETCAQAGFATTLVDVSDIGWKDGRFVDLEDHGIGALFKLYPWEWMVTEPFARHLPGAGLRLVEPAWKQVLSNKSLLPLLWIAIAGIHTCCLLRTTPAISKGRSWPSRGSDARARACMSRIAASTSRNPAWCTKPTRPFTEVTPATGWSACGWWATKRLASACARTRIRLPATPVASFRTVSTESPHPSACARSATRSSPSSSPTEMRSRF